jgi:magnesium chelatase family protein
MLAKTRSCALVGLDGVMVETEVDIAPGLPAFYIVGLADIAVQESKERVRTTILNSGIEFPILALLRTLTWALWRSGTTAPSKTQPSP